MAASPPRSAWSRQRLAVVLGLGVVVALMVLAGLGLTLYQLVVAQKVEVDAVAGDLPSASTDRRDEIAAAPMAEVPQDAGFTPDPALSPAPPILIPIATHGRGSAGVATGFPHTPEGAVGDCCTCR